MYCEFNSVCPFLEKVKFHTYIFCSEFRQIILSNSDFPCIRRKRSQLPTTYWNERQNTARTIKPRDLFLPLGTIDKKVKAYILCCPIHDRRHQIGDAQPRELSESFFMVQKEIVEWANGAKWICFICVMKESCKLTCDKATLSKWGKYRRELRNNMRTVSAFIIFCSSSSCHDQFIKPNWAIATEKNNEETHLIATSMRPFGIPEFHYVHFCFDQPLWLDQNRTKIFLPIFPLGNLWFHIHLFHLVISRYGQNNLFSGFGMHVSCFSIWKYVPKKIAILDWKFTFRISILLYFDAYRTYRISKKSLLNITI